LWESSVLVITFDEHGGFYDHVPPPPAPSPNDGSIDHSYGFRYDRLGVRVPALIISPWVPRHTVDHAQYDHTSLLATVERLFGLDHLTDRDLKAADFLATLSLPQPRTNTPATLGDVLDGALVSSISAPSNLTPGQQGQVSVTLQNAGATAWTSSEGYRLGSAQPVDNTTWGASRVELPHDVAPGASVTFTFTVTAPASPQTTTMAWGMVQEQVHWFGQEASQQVVVARSPACVSMANEIASWQSQRDEAHQELQQLDFTDPTSRIEAKRLTAAIAALSSHITAMQAQMTADGCT
jgi:hypothetical protein